jgi:type VI secretion system secreted protein VgrG
MAQHAKTERASASVQLRKQKAVEAVERLGESLHEAVIVGGQQSTAIGGAQTVDVGTAHSLTVGSRQTTDIGTDQVVTIGGNQTITIGKSRTTEIAKDDDLDIKKDLTVIVGGKIRITGERELRIEVGSALLVLNVDGSILVRGTSIEIEGSDEVHLKGSNVHTN